MYLLPNIRSLIRLRFFQCTRLNNHKSTFLSYLLPQIAFSNCYVLDDGETAVGTGARAKPDYQGIGLIAKANQASLLAARTRFPQLKIEARVAMDSAFYDQYTKPNPKGVKIICKKVSIQS